MNIRSFLPYSPALLAISIAISISGCASDGEPSGAATAEISAVCGRSAMLAGKGLVGDLRAAVDPRFVQFGRVVEVPGALRAVNSGFSLFGLEPVDAVEGAAIVVRHEETTTAVLGGKDRATDPFGGVAEDGAQRLFDAMSQADETVVAGERRRTTAKGFVSCTEHATSPATHSCAIKNVQSITPSSGPVFDRPICGLVACRTTLIRLRIGVIEDLIGALGPDHQQGDLAIPEVLTGFVGMGTETLTTVAGVRIDDQELLTQNDSPLSMTFGGRRVGTGPGTAGFRAAKALYEAMTQVPETVDANLARTRTSPGGRARCTEQANSMDGGVFYSCQITEIHRYDPTTPSAGSPVCASE